MLSAVVAAWSLATLPQAPSGDTIDPEKIWKSPDIHRACIETLKGMEHPYFKRVAEAAERGGYRFKIPTDTEKPDFKITPTVYAVTSTPTKTVWLIKDNIGSSGEILFEVFANEGAHIIINPSKYPSFSEVGAKTFLEEFKSGSRKQDFEGIMGAISHETASFLPGFLITQESRGTPVKTLTALAPTADTFFRRATYQVLSRVFPEPVFAKLNSIPPIDTPEGYFVRQITEDASSGRVGERIKKDLEAMGFNLKDE